MRHLPCLKWILLFALSLVAALQPIVPVSANGIGTVYVASEAARSISVLDTNTNTVVEVIPLEHPPLAIAFSPDARFVYFSHSDTNGISVVETSVEDVTGYIRLGSQVGDITMVAAGPLLLATDPQEGQLRVIDPLERRQLFSIPVAGAPQSVVATPDGATAFVADRASGQLCVVDLRKRTVVRTSKVGGAGLHLAVSPAGTEVLVGGRDAKDLLLLDASSGQVIRSIPAGPSASAVAFSPIGDLAYVPSGDRSEIAVVDVKSGARAGAIPLSARAAALGVARDGKHAYVALKDVDRVAVVDLAGRTVVAEVAVEKDPVRVAVSPLQPKSEGVVMPAALPNTGGGPAAPYRDPVLILAMLLVGSLSAAGLLWSRTRRG